MVPVIKPLSGMMFSAVPAEICPQVRISGSFWLRSRLLMACSAMTIWASTLIGSMPSSGREPWLPRPWTVIRKPSAEALAGPMVWVTVPVSKSDAGAECIPKAASTWGSSSRPASTMCRAPL